jgi:hypothetical protein
MIIFILSLVFVTPARAQETGWLSGTLHDSATSRPIAGAAVRIMAISIPHEFSTETDNQGRFAYVGLAPGTYIVTITQQGYVATDVFDLIIVRGEPTRLKLTMIPAERTSLKRQLIRYRRPLINTENASSKFVFRTGV